MSLKDYEVSSDNFEAAAEDEVSFPCNACIHKYVQRDAEPCLTCGHNNAASRVHVTHNQDTVTVNGVRGVFVAGKTCKCCCFQASDLCRFIPCTGSERGDGRSGHFEEAE